MSVIKRGPARKLSKPHYTRMQKIVQHWYPEIAAKGATLTVHDVLKAFKAPLTLTQIQRGVQLDCTKCAVALAVASLGVKPIIVARGGISYVIEVQGKAWHLIRVGVPLATQLLINRQDKGGKIEPQDVWFAAITPTQRLGGRKNTEKPRGPHLNPAHRSGLRNWLGETA